MFNIILASPRGYCAGVDRAIKMLDEILEKHGAPIYVNHEIVHNRFIVSYFEKKGVIFTDELDIISTGEIMVFSAHGVAPSYIKRVKEKGIKYIDASCPLVTKVHNEAIKFLENGYEIIYIGKKTHQEAIGVADNDLDKIHIVSTESDLNSLNFQEGQKLALLNQTTLSVDDTKELINKIQEIYSDIELPGFSDICYATTNRQNAVKQIMPEIDALIIVGSQNSSNSQKLKGIGDATGVPAILIDSLKEIPEGFLDGITSLGISSGASVPDQLVLELIKELKNKGGKFLKEIKITEEKMIFPYNLELQ